MEKSIRIDKETYRTTSFNAHQHIALQRIFEKLKDPQCEIDLYLEFDVFTETIQSYILLKNKKTALELPFLSKKNRKFYIENIIVPERFLFHGENVIYIFELILKNTQEINLKNIISQLKLFEIEDNSD